MTEKQTEALPVEPDRPDSTEVALVHPDEIGMDRLQRQPIIERIDERQLDLIAHTVAVAEGEIPITKAEIGHFLELCAMYGLDPFAREAWIAKSKRGKLLIMVGRDGLRKIVQRNGCEMESDVVHKEDVFAYERRVTEDGRPYHDVTHKVSAFQRGEILGAWARVYERKTRIERGFFVAAIGEYKPSGASEYSPWSKQVSTMIQGAAERQAARQATPLGGLLLEGEDESANAARTIGIGEGDGSEPGWSGLSDEQVADVEALLSVAAELGAGMDRAAVQMRLNGRPDAVAAWLEDTTAMLAKHQEEEPEPGEQQSLDTEGGES